MEDINKKAQDDELNNDWDEIENAPTTRRYVRVPKVNKEKPNKTDNNGSKS